MASYCVWSFQLLWGELEEKGLGKKLIIARMQILTVLNCGNHLLGGSLGFHKGWILCSSPHSVFFFLFFVATGFAFLCIFWIGIQRTLFVKQLITWYLLYTEISIKVNEYKNFLIVWNKFYNLSSNVKIHAHIHVYNNIV